jgi:hypothetical protein
MDRIQIPAGTCDLARRGAGLRPRPLLAEQEKAAAATPARDDRAESLDGYVPSALIPTEKRLLALAVGGAPAWSRRLKRIETLTEALLAALAVAWQDLACTARGDRLRFDQAWRQHAARVDFEPINDLIRRHNEYYPIERRLPMDVRTGDFVGPGGREFRRRPLDADWVLSHFPADLERARA